MTILNPQYSFLEADYKNSSLNGAKLEYENISIDVQQQNLETNIDVKRSLKYTIIWLLVKINPMATILVWVPADIYCVVFLMTGEMMTF